MAKLTKTVVENAKGPEVKAPGDRKRWKWYGDTEVPGFGLRVYGSGLKVYALRYRTRTNRSRTLKLGAHGELTVQKARDMARAEKVRILEGEDPQREREKKREARGLSTVNELMEAWLRGHAEVHRTRAAEDRWRSELHILPALGRMHLEDVTVARLSRWHREIGAEAPVQANRCLETLRAAWRWAEDEERLPEGAPDSKIFKGGRRAKIHRFREKSRTRWLNEDELSRLMAAVQAEKDPYVRAAIPVLVLTGLRKRELLGAKWEDADLERGELRLPETKNGEEQRRLLPPAAVTILRDLPRMEESDYIFPSPSDPSRPRDDLKGPWRRIRVVAGLPNATMHDLRRTAGSLMAQRGVPIEHIGQVLGHSRNEAVTRIYARLSNDNRRDALATLSDALSGPLGFAKKREEPQDLPEQLVALVEATKDDPEAFRAGLRALGLGEAVEA